jgi:hypothetical protein
MPRRDTTGYTESTGVSVGVLLRLGVLTSVVLDHIQDVLRSSCNLVLDDDPFLSLNVSYSLISLNSLSVASAQCFHSSCRVRAPVRGFVERDTHTCIQVWFGTNEAWLGWRV